jgi:hypothetical protein
MRAEPASAATASNRNEKRRKIVMPAKQADLPA